MSQGSRARDEAEKLVAAALAAASLAARGLGNARNSAQTLQTLGGLAERFLGPPEGGSARPHAADQSRHTFSNGSAECCVCPVCKTIAALRDPSPEFTERLASGASDLAAGIAGVMRAFAGNRPPTDLRDWLESDLGGEDDLRDDDPWRTATRASEARNVAGSTGRGQTDTTREQGTGPEKPVPPKPMAKKATRPMAAAKNETIKAGATAKIATGTAGAKADKPPVKASVHPAKATAATPVAKAPPKKAVIKAVKSATAARVSADDPVAALKPSRQPAKKPTKARKNTPKSSLLDEG